MFTKSLVVHLVAFCAIAAAGFAGARSHDHAADAAPTQNDASTAFGVALPTMTATPLAQVLAETPLAKGKQLISGRIGKVCQNKGCWMTLHDGDTMVRVETGHRFTIPAAAAGDAVVYGTLKHSLLDEDRAAHLRSESLDVAAGEAWTIDATAVRILQ